MSIPVRLTSEPDAAIAVESPYDAAFLDGLKQAIPWEGRQWVRDRKRWIVSALYASHLLTFLDQVGAHIRDDRADAQALVPLPPMPEELKTAFDVLHLQYTAPLGAADAVFRFYSTYSHPDKGGDVERFHAVNDAIQAIRFYLTPREEAGDENDDIPF